MTRRVKVNWYTEETTYYEAELDVPDDVEDVDSYFFDGNCPTLIAHEDAEFERDGRRFDEFTRSVASLDWIEGKPELPVIEAPWAICDSEDDGIVDRYADPAEGARALLTYGQRFYLRYVPEGG